MCIRVSGHISDSKKSVSMTYDPGNRQLERGVRDA